MTRWSLSLTLLLALTLPAAAQLPPEKALATMQPAPGFQVELFASEPLLFNPTSMDVDHTGRVWVAEAVNYRRKPPYNRPMLRKEGDRIVVLVDTNGDGKADESKVFYQGEDIYGPLSVCVIPQPDGKALRVLVAQSPDILEFWDKDGDLKADGPPKKFLTNFRGIDHDHGVHGLNVGPDGKLYFTVGDSGVGGLQSSDGKGRKWTSNDTDCRAGTVWRCDLDGTNLELIAHNFRNNYECCVDSFGEIWLSDNDDDGNNQTRICFVMPGGNYGYHPRGPGQTHWHEEQPGVVHKTLRTGFGSPTGITFYEGALFDKKYAGALLHCDAGPREVRAFFRKPKGAGYELDKEVILTSTDAWFRPSDVCVAPDGSIFVADWYDKGVGGHGMNDPQDGRIYRLTPKGREGYAVSEVNLDKPEGIVAALGSPCQATRYLGMQSLIAESRHDKDAVRKSMVSYDKYMEAVGQVLFRTIPLADWELPPSILLKKHEQLISTFKAIDATRRLIMIRQRWVLAALGVDPEVAFGREPFRGPVPLPLAERWVDVIASASLGRSTPRKPITRLGEFMGNGPTGVRGLPVDFRREILLAMRRLDAKKIGPAFYKLAQVYDGQDIFYRAALNIALGTDPARRDAILADFDEHFPEWNDEVADLVWELRPKSVLPRLEKLLVDAKLTPAQKGRIIDILAINDDPAAGVTLLNVLKSDAAPEMKARAIESLRLFLPTKWKSLLGSKELNAAMDDLLKKQDTQIVGLQLIAAVRAVDRVDAVIKIANGPNGVANYADPIQDEAILTLGKLKTAASVQVLKTEALATTVNPAPLPRVTNAINGLASMITGQPKDELGAKAMAVLQELVNEKGHAFPRRQLAVEALAGTRPGTVWLLDQHAKGNLPKELVADAGKLLRNSPHQDLRNRALLAFPAPGKLNPKALPALAELAKRTGNPDRGKEVWDASLAGAAQCAKCHTVRGVGGQVGPDLSMIGKKGGKENLFESILLPSKAIADQYVQQSITTTADVTITGLVVSDTPQGVTIRDANGKDTVIARGDIASQKKLQVSIMPEDIVAALNEDELIDLVAYMTTLQTAALTPESFHIMGPFVGKSMKEALDEQYGPEKYPFRAGSMFPQRPVKPNEVVPAVEWRTIRPESNGYFDLAKFHGAAGNNSASYMYVEIESPVDQDAEVLLGTDDGAKLYVNGKEVFKTEQTRAAAPNQEKVAVKLAKGKNTVLLKVANGNNPHGFYFTLLSKEETKVAK